MTKYMKAHEKYIMDMISNNKATKEVLEFHRTQIEHLKHERFVHLIVMSLFALLLIIMLLAFFFAPNPFFGALTAILFVTEIFYVAHYYRLENTVQKWYKIENSIGEKLVGVGCNFI